MRLYYRLRVQPHIFVALSLISKSSLPSRDCLQPLAKCKIELSAFLLGAFLSSYSQPASQPVSLAWPSTNYTQLIEASARRLAERVELNVLEIATYVFRRIFANVPPPKIPCLPACLSILLPFSLSLFFLNFHFQKRGDRVCSDCLRRKSENISAILRLALLGTNVV